MTAYGRHDYRRRWFGWVARDRLGAEMVFMWGPVLRHAPHWIHRPLERYHCRQPYFLRASVRLAGWILAAAPFFFARPWLSPLGPALFEIWLRIAGGRALRRLPASPPWPFGPDDPDAGMREPRRPYPNAGAGAVALPEPFESEA